MKFFAAIALLALSLTASAESCFTRTTSIQLNGVTLASTICFAEPELELHYFEDSYVLLHYSIDGQRAFKRAKVKGELNNDDMFVVNVGIENNTEGGFCDFYFQASSTVTVKIKKDQSKAVVDSMSGKIYFSSDLCHVQPELVQTINYTRN